MASPSQRHTFEAVFKSMKQSWYRAFHRFGQTKFPNGGSVLVSSQFSVLPQLPPKAMLSLKEIKSDSIKSNSHC